jgi:hypothetical protein
MEYQDNTPGGQIKNWNFRLLVSGIMRYTIGCINKGGECENGTDKL